MAADGSVIIEVDMDTNDAEKELARLTKDIKKTQAAVNELGSKKAPLEEQAKALRVQINAARKEVEQYNKAWQAGTPGADYNAEAARSKVQLLESELSKTNVQIDKIDKKLLPAEDTLERSTLRASQLQKQLAETADNASLLDPALSKAEKMMERFSNKVKGLAKRVFVFSLITSALRGMREWFWNIAKAQPETSAALSKLKASFLILAQPVVNVLIPALVKLMDILTRLTASFAKTFSKLFGTTVQESAQAAENLYNEQQAIKGVGTAAKKASKDLASFDEINKLSGDNAESSGGVAAGSVAPDFKGAIEGELGALEAVIGGFLLALGAILTFTGANPVLGIALMAIGALKLGEAIEENKAVIENYIGMPLKEAENLLSKAFLVIGALLVFTGANILLGLGLLAIGALKLAENGEVDWGAVYNKLVKEIDLIETLVGAALLTVGALLVFTKVNIPLGLGLLAAGAVILAHELTENWEFIEKQLEGKIGAIQAVISVAFLALGALLIFTGANIPLGLGLLAVGALGLVAVIAANWDEIPELLKGPLGDIMVIAGMFLFAFGALLVFSGAAIPLGLGMMLAGGISLAAPVAANWEYILQKLKGTWQNIKTWWSNGPKKYFTYEYWRDLAKNMVDGFFEYFNKIGEGIESLFSSLGNKKLKLQTTSPKINTNSRLRAATLPVPRLAQGAVIPPNREFMAVLGDQKNGTNIEAPLETIVQALRIALQDNGGGQVIENIVNLDGETIYRNQQRVSKRHGKSLVKGY